METIDSFQGKYRFLSNFWPSEVLLYGLIYPTVEHAYQAAKTNDLDDREIIRNLDTPGRAKSRGKSVVLREDWEDIKFSLMSDLVYQKFSKNDYLSDMLVETGDTKIIEGNTWGDTYWGVCKGVGENNLGKILMKVRKSLNSPDIAFTYTSLYGR